MSFTKQRADEQDRYRRELHTATVLCRNADGSYDVQLPGIDQAVRGVANGSAVALQAGNRVVVQRLAGRGAWQILTAMAGGAPGGFTDARALLETPTALGAPSLLINGDFRLATRLRVASPGTVTCAGGTVVTGTGTDWSSFDVGGRLRIGGAWYGIAAVGGATTLTLATNGPVVTGAAYEIAHQAADGAYAWDRWYVLAHTGPVEVSQVASGLTACAHAGRVTQKQATPQRVGVAQVVEAGNVIPTRGQALTAALQARLSVAGTVRVALVAWTGAEDLPVKDIVANWAATQYTPGGFFIATNCSVLGTVAVAAAANAWTPVTVTGTPPATATNLYLMVWSDAPLPHNATFDLAQADLHPGPARPWGLAPEGGRMGWRVERYCFGIKMSGVLWFGFRVLTNYVMFDIPLPKSMRIPPIATNNMGIWQVSSPTGNDMAAIDLLGNFITISGALTVTYSGANSEIIEQRFIAGTSFSGSPGIAIRLAFGSSARIILDSELGV